MSDQLRPDGSLRHLLTLEGLSKAQLERLLDEVLVGETEMMGAIDAVCAQASRIIGRLTAHAASGAVPSVTTDSSIRRTWRAVEALTTRVLVGGAAAWKVPSGAVNPATSVGSTRTPSLAIVA